MAKPKAPGNSSVVLKTAKPTAAQDTLRGSQIAIERGQRTKQQAAQNMARMGGPQLPITPRDTTGKPQAIQVDKRGFVTNPAGVALKRVVGSTVAKARTANSRVGKVAAAAKSSGTSGTRLRSGSTQPLARAAKDTPSSGSSGSGQASPNPATPTDPLSLLQTMLGTAGNIGTLLDPGAYATSVAGGQFDPVIQQLQDQASLAPQQAAQNQTDIQSWYGQVLKSLGAAGADEKTANTNAQTSLGDVVKGIIGSLGGAANQGSGLVGAAGADAVGTEQALGNIQQGYNDQMTPLLQLAQNSASSSDKARMDTLQRDIASQIAQAQGSKSSAYQQALAQAQQQNAATQQQRLGDQTGLLGEILTAQLNGNNQLLTAGVDQARVDAYRAQAKKNAAAANKPPAPAKNSWEIYDPVKKAQLAQAAIAAMKAAGGEKNIHGSLAALNGVVGQAGFNPNDPALAPWRNSIWSAGFNVPAATVYGH